MIASIIILVLLSMELGAALYSHGEIKETRVNFWTKLINIGLELLLFYYAGLFDNFK